MPIVLLTNGPGSGEVMAGQVIAEVDPVAVDAFATRYFDLTPETSTHPDRLRLGVGEMVSAQDQEFAV
jgi:hypothetical protein